MSGRYTPAQLQQMARHALQARDAGDARWLQLVFSMAMRGRWTPRDIELAIQRLAATGTA